MTYFTAMKFNIKEKTPRLHKRIDFPSHNKDEIKLLKTIAQTVSISELSEKIFLQRDIKGFEADFFYIIKPNEYKCWHRAIAHYDLAEFQNALIKSEMEEA